MAQMVVYLALPDNLKFLIAAYPLNNSGRGKLEQACGRSRY